MARKRTPTGLLDGLIGLGGDSQEVLDDASVFHFPGKSGLSGTYQGRAAIVGLLEKLGQVTDGTLEFVPERIVGRGSDTVVVLTRSRATRRGKHLDAAAIHVLSRRGDAVRELWLLHPDQQRVDEFWMD